MNLSFPCYLTKKADQHLFTLTRKKKLTSSVTCPALSCNCCSSVLGAPFSAAGVGAGILRANIEITVFRKTLRYVAETRAPPRSSNGAAPLVKIRRKIGKSINGQRGVQPHCFTVNSVQRWNIIESPPSTFSSRTAKRRKSNIDRERRVHLPDLECKGGAKKSMDVGVNCRKTRTCRGKNTFNFQAHSLLNEVALAPFNPSTPTLRSLKCSKGAVTVTDWQLLKLKERRTKGRFWLLLQCCHNTILICRKSTMLFQNLLNV